MNPSAWIALAGLAFTMFATIIGTVIWAVRLEGRQAANDLAIRNTLDAVSSYAKTTEAAIAALHVRANDADGTKIEVVRLQEQIKHLTDLIEKWLQPIQPLPAPPRPRRSSKSGDV